jgi:uncharacterized protein (TIGR02147 family)
VEACPADAFRRTLQAELARRCSRNSRYSLRAFAKYLGVDHSTLSQLLRGKRRLTDATVRKLGYRLGLEPAQIEIFAAAARAEPARAVPAEAPVTQLAAEALLVLRNRHHLAILELVRLPTFRPDVRWIARVLDTSPDQVNVALQHLLRLGLLRMKSPDRWVVEGDAAAGPAEFARAVIERLADATRRLPRS